MPRARRRARRHLHLSTSSLLGPLSLQSSFHALSESRKRIPFYLLSEYFASFISFRLYLTYPPFPHLCLCSRIAPLANLSSSPPPSSIILANTPLYS